MVLNKEIGIQTDDFEYIFSQNNNKNRPFDEVKVRFYKGLNSFEVLMKTFHFVAPHVKRRSMYVNKFQEFIMVLLKLRLIVPYLNLADRFEVSRSVIGYGHLSVSFNCLANT